MKAAPSMAAMTKSAPPMKMKMKMPMKKAAVKRKMPMKKSRKKTGGMCDLRWTRAFQTPSTATT